MFYIFLFVVVSYIQIPACNEGWGLASSGVAQLFFTSLANAALMFLLHLKVPFYFGTCLIVLIPLVAVSCISSIMPELCLLFQLLFPFILVAFSYVANASYHTYRFSILISDGYLFFLREYRFPS